MKKLLIIPLLLINGCSSFSLFGDRTSPQPQVKPVEVVSVAKRAPIYHPPLPEPIESAKKTQAQIQNLNTQYSASQAQVTNLRNKFAKHNLEGMALAKPGLLQGKVNKASARVVENLTVITNPDQFDEKAADNTSTTN